MIQYILLATGLAYIGRFVSENEEVVILNDCLSVKTIDIPMPNGQGSISIRSTPQMLPVDHLSHGPTDGFEIPASLIMRRIEAPLDHPLVAHYVKMTSRIELPT